MKIAVAPNLQKKDAEACAREATGILEACGWEVVQACGLYQEGLRRRAAEEALADCQILLAIGGDGTIIHAAKAAAAWDIPILGVNAGKLGFTAGLEREELAMLSRLTEPDLPEERRMMLHVTLTGPQSSQSFLALNDAVVSAELAAIIDYQVSLGRERSYNCRADGFIVATPTGSTAYTLSAGGPVVEPALNCMLYTPICPHSLFNRSIVFAPDTALMVYIPQNRGKLFLTTDGEPPVELRAGDRLIFAKSSQSPRFIKLTESNFYDILSQKLLVNQ